MNILPANAAAATSANPISPAVINPATNQYQSTGFPAHRANDPRQIASSAHPPFVADPRLSSSHQSLTPTDSISVTSSRLLHEQSASPAALSEPNAPSTALNTETTTSSSSTTDQVQRLAALLQQQRQKTAQS